MRAGSAFSGSTVIIIGSCTSFSKNMPSLQYFLFSKGSLLLMRGAHRSIKQRAVLESTLPVAIEKIIGE
tara:strand:+ start:2311 stop:2517 length:207 start_codon:yes stop_codon:yes gene_type:complete